LALTSTTKDVLQATVWPPLDDESLDRVRVDDVADIDYLYVHLLGKPMPAVWDPIGDGDAYLGYRMDGEEVTDQVVGIMVGQFREAVLARHPAWACVATATGEAKRAELRSLIADISAMIRSDLSSAQFDQPEARS
jgi:hypothetical protein